MTVEQVLAEAERLLKDITPGEWTLVSRENSDPHEGTDYWVNFGESGEDCTLPPRADAEFIAASPRLVRELLTALRSLPPQKEEKEQGALTRMDTPKVTSDDSRTAPTSDPTRTGQRGIARLAGLSDGWHREGAYICPRISDAAITRATHVQAMLAEMWAVPMPDGGVQLECHGHGFDLEVTIDPAGDVYDASADLAQAIEDSRRSLPPVPMQEVLAELVSAWRERAPRLATSGYYGDMSASNAVENCADELAAALRSLASPKSTAPHVTEE